jgi:multiple sugar transport system permease protein
MDAISELRKARTAKREKVRFDREARWGLAFLSPWMIGFLLFYLLPMIASFVFSLFKFNPALPDEAVFIGLENWKRALTQDEEIRLSFIRTIRFTLISLPITMSFTLFIAILLNSKHVIGKTLYRTLFYLPSMIPVVATVLIWNGVLNEHSGWINMIIEWATGIQAVGTEGIRWLNDPQLIYYAYTMFGLWGIGGGMIIFLAGLQGIPTELYEAAEIDGASWFRRLFRITLPLLTPVIFYQLVLGVIASLQYFLAPFVLNQGDGSPEGMTRFIYVYFYKQSFTFFNMGYGATIAWLLFIVSLVITIILFGTARYWVFYASEER